MILIARDDKLQVAEKKSSCIWMNTFSISRCTKNIKISVNFLLLFLCDLAYSVRSLFLVQNFQLFISPVKSFRMHFLISVWLCSSTTLYEWQFAKFSILSLPIEKNSERLFQKQHWVFIVFYCVTYIAVCFDTYRSMKTFFNAKCQQSDPQHKILYSWRRLCFKDMPILFDFVTWSFTQKPKSATGLYIYHPQDNFLKLQKSVYSESIFWRPRVIRCWINVENSIKTSVYQAANCWNLMARRWGHLTLLWDIFGNAKQFSMLSVNRMIHSIRFFVVYSQLNESVYNTTTLFWLSSCCYKWQMEGCIRKKIINFSWKLIAKWGENFVSKICQFF